MKIFAISVILSITIIWLFIITLHSNVITIVAVISAAIIGATVAHQWQMKNWRKQTNIKIAQKKVSGLENLSKDFLEAASTRRTITQQIVLHHLQNGEIPDSMKSEYFASIQRWNNIRPSLKARMVRLLKQGTELYDDIEQKIGRPLRVYSGRLQNIDGIGSDPFQKMRLLKKINNDLDNIEFLILQIARDIMIESEKAYADIMDDRLEFWENLRRHKIKNVSVTDLTKVAFGLEPLRRTLR